ncbi:hypothetical protein [Luteimonas mephitis]|uniref:hypothetical protein n=1 Tax=Luteimonas mephitis TaxID=83615 RepID=UPI0003FB8FB1|nr:hypothetical protein [Luteimonas mephitis]
MPLRSLRYFPAAVLCALLAAALLLPGLGGGFLLDDTPTIGNNAAVHVATLDAGSLQRAAYSFAAGGGSRALPMLTFAIDYWRAGLDPAAFKSTNIAIHALTTLALAGLLRLLLTLAGWPARRAGYGAIALTLAWAIHPLQVSSVLYVVQRMQTMGTLLLVLALYAYLKMRQAQMAGERSRQYGVLSGLCWVLALACKEDSALLPAYTLALELTVLRFRAARPDFAKAIGRLYLATSLLGIAIFLFYVVPHYWSWDAYAGRNFSSSERLLTQARVLCMYLGQILWPLPSHMPFYYDDLQPSRGLLHPWTTLPALLLVFGLLALAWRLRARRPLFALGIFLFFAGHAISSNVIGLELAFEHRNHFPLIGAVLALSDLFVAAAARLRLSSRATGLACVAILVALGGGTLWRAQAWGSPVGFAEYGTRLAPASERAWINLCEIHFELSGNRPGDPHFAKALDTCGKGAQIPYGATNLTNLVVLKTIDGSVRQSDWDQLFERMGQVTMTRSNADVAWHLVRYSNGDKRIDPRNVIHVVDIVGARSGFRPEEYVAFGYYAAKNGLDEDAFRYFVKAAETSPRNSTLPMALVADLRKEGQPEFAARLLALLEQEHARGQRAGP